ncbi:MAG: hypothetical protein ACOX75_04460 [Lachnospiraceae bacterium]
MKKFAIVIIGILLIAGLVACDDKGDSGQVSQAAETGQVSEAGETGETDKADEAGKAGDSAVEKNPYNLDFESTEFQDMSVDKKASVETLEETAMEWLEGDTMFVGTKFADYTYEDVAEHIGVDATMYCYDDQALGRRYIWEAEDDIASWFAITLKERGGVWVLDESMSYLRE